MGFRGHYHPDELVDEHDDFNIVDEEREGASRTWIWVAIVAVVAIFAFGVGAALMLVSNRLTSPQPLPATTPSSPTRIAISGTATLTGTPVITVTRTPTASVTPTPTATLSPTVTPTSATVCTQGVDDRLAPLFDKDQLGCALDPSATVWAAWQPFERGAMLWRSDTDRAYVFYSDGWWFPVDERWDGAPSVDRGNPPEGRQAPIRGFGYVWSRSDTIFSRLGWATDQERGFCALVQNFDKGFLLRSDPVPSCTAEGLYNQATAPEWREVQLAAVEARRADNGTASSVPQPDPGRSVESLVRPANQGAFPAPHLDGLIVDANFSEWSGDWQPINAIVFGGDRHKGPGDLSANFQVAWLKEGLALAARVNDDRFRPGPNGTNMWQGDGLELHFDRQLVQDFTSTQADEDDYQLGIAPAANYNGVRGYRWLPFAQESALDFPNAAVATPRGYKLEVLIPWSAFDLDGADIQANQVYGFNLSVSDNDGDGPVQQTVASASAARTTHDNPTEWGTLRLQP